jgi:hypothetical protein
MMKLAATTILAAGLLAACTPTTPAGPDPAALAKATTDAVNAALAARDADDTKIHGDAGPAVYFVNLRDGETVTSPFRVVFGLYGMGIAPAGPPAADAGKAKPGATPAPAAVPTGHHHLLIDTTMSDEELKSAIPKDATHMHFGGGQTETVLQLPAGTHTLQLVLGDNMHTPASPPVMSKKITITVK